MLSLGSTFWELLEHFFSWLASLFYEKERRPDCEEQIGLPTQAVHRKTIPLDATSTTSKNRQGIQGRPPRHPEWARQNVFRHPSSKRNAVYDVRLPRKRRPALGPPLIHFDSAPQRLSHRNHTTPTIRIEDWSILPPRKFLSQRLSFLTAPTRALRLSSFIPDTRHELLAVPSTDSLGHLCFPYSSRGTGQSKHVDKNGSEHTNVFISKPALPSGLCRRIANERPSFDLIEQKVVDNRLRYPQNVGDSFTRKLPESFRKSMPVSKGISKKLQFYSLPAAMFPSLLCTDAQAEQDICASNQWERVGPGLETIANNLVNPAVPYVSIDSTSSAKAHEKAGSPTTTLTVTHDSQSFFGLSAPAKLPYADFGDVPYPFLFDLDFYLSENDAPATPLLLVSFPGLSSEFSSPPTDYFDTPTPSPKLPTAPLLMQQDNLSNTVDFTCKTQDSSKTSGDLVPERVIRESLGTFGTTLSLHSSVIEDILSSQSEYSIPSTDDVRNSSTSSDFGKPTEDDLEKLTLDHIGNSSHTNNLSTIKTASSEARRSGEGGGALLPEKDFIDACLPVDENGVRMMNETLASLEYVSCSLTDKSRESGSEGESEGVMDTKTEDSLTIDESTFCNRHRRLLENLSFSISKKMQPQSRKKDTSTDVSILSEPSNVASVVARSSVRGVSSNNGAYSQSPRAVDNVNIVIESHFHPASRGDLVTGQRKMRYRPAGPFKPLTPMLIPSVGIGVRERMMRLGIHGLQGGSERERSKFIPVDQELGGTRPRGAELSLVARRKEMPERF